MNKRVGIKKIIVALMSHRVECDGEKIVCARFIGIFRVRCIEL